MLSAIVFIFYFTVLLLALATLTKKNQINISFSTLTFIYAFKVLSGCAYGYIFLKFYRGDDTWMYHRASLVEYQKLIHHPIGFIKDFLPYSAFRASNGFWQGIQFYIQDLEYWTMSKLLALFNIFSRGNYYINVLFFDFFTVIGLLLLYKLLMSFFHNKKKMLIAALFFLPLTTFWLSGIRAEGLLLLCIAIILYYSNEWFNNKRKVVHLIFMLSGMIGCLILRAQLLLVFFPAFFCLLLSWRNASKAVYVFGSVYFFCTAIFFGSLFFSPQKNLGMPVIKRQQEFFMLHANTSFKLDSLQPSPTSFVKVLPQALSNTFLRPFIWEAKGFLQFLTALDTVFFWILLLASILFHETGWKEILKNPLILLFLFYSLNQIILIGYIVPFPGAIVRYKSIPELFLFICLLSVANFNQLINKFIKAEKKDIQ